MAEDTISNFTAEPGKLAELLGIWNGQRQRMYQNKRAAMKEHRGNCANNCAGKVDPQWPAWSAGDLKESYLSELAKVKVVGCSQQQQSKNPRRFYAAPLSREVIKYGEMAQVTYDKLETKNVFSPHFGECRDGWIKLHHSDPDNTLLVGREARRYRVVKLLYADSGAYKLVRTDKKKKNFVGFVAVEQEVPAKRGADVAIVWRGTISHDEWIQDAKAFMVAWKGGRQVADVPRIKLNLPPGSWLGLTTAAGLAAALWFARTHTKPLEGFFTEVHDAASRVVLFLYEQRGQLADHLSGSLPAPAQRVADALLLGPVLALGGHATRGMLATIDLAGAAAAAAAECTHLVSPGALVCVALAAGLVIGVASLPLSQRLRTNKGNLGLLWEDLCGLPGLVREWLCYGVVSSAYSRLAASDARVSYGFKEMYCDVNPDGVLVNPKEGEKRLGPPRQQVFDALAELDVEIGSITTTGHSLGGALAALCAYDIADRLNSVAAGEDHLLHRGLQYLGSDALAKGARLAVQGTQSVAGRALSDRVEDVYAKTDEAVKRFCDATDIKRGGGAMPPVTAVTFGAPRVGDRNFAAKFGDPSNTTPPWVPKAFFLNIPVAFDRIGSSLSSASWWATSHGIDLENYLVWFLWTYLFFMSAWLLGKHVLPAIIPLWSPAWTPGITNVFLCLAAVWQFFPVAVNIGSALAQAVARVLMHRSGLAQPQKAQCQLRMLRVINSGDAVPGVPLGPVTGGRWYRHGGVELRRTPYIMPEFVRFQKVPLLGSALGAPLGSKHNLEVYMHLVDPTRDRHLMNKSADVLVKTCSVPPCWYQPVANTGLIWNPETGQVETEREKAKRVEE